MASVAQTISETRRDALVAYTLTKVKLPDGVNDANSLYTHLLIDNQISAEVKTSRVSSAIASIQQYINGIMLRMEDEAPDIDAQEVKRWNGIGSQYAVWSANQALQDAPENYIAPALRYGKTRYFRELEDGLNKGKINEDVVRQVTLNYLSRFEELSNLQMVSGYFDSSMLSQARYYFIGKTNSAPFRYYWRELDMNKVPKESAKITPNAWGDWEPIDIALDGVTVLPHTVRPMHYNNRLYVAWVERVAQSMVDSAGKPRNTHQYFVRMSYKLFDGTWTAPLACLMAEIEEKTGAGGKDKNAAFSERMELLFLADIRIRPHRLFVGLFEFDKATPIVHEIPTKQYNQVFSSSLERLGSYVKEDKVQEAQLIHWYAMFESRNVLQRTSISKMEVTEVENAEKDNEARIPATAIKDIAEKDFVFNLQNQTLTITAEAAQEINQRTIAGVALFKCKATSLIRGNRPYHDMTFEDLVWEYKPNPYQEDKNVKKMHISGVMRYAGTGGIFRGHKQADVQRISVQYEDEVDVKGQLSEGAPKKHGFDKAFIRVDSRNDRPGHDGGFTLTGVGEWQELTYYFNFSEKLVSCFIDDKDASERLYNLLQKGGRTCFRISGQLNKPGEPEKWVHAKIAEFQWTPTPSKYSCYFKDLDGKPTREKEGDVISKGTKWSIDLKMADIPDGKNTIDYGVRRRQDGKAADLTKSVTFNYLPAKEGDAISPPVLGSSAEGKLGKVYYVDFSNAKGVGEDSDDAPKVSRFGKVRLNTTFVNELVGRASVGLPRLLDYKTQILELEPPMPANPVKPPMTDVAGATGEPIDFYGANGICFWELFFHLPHLVACRLNQERSYDEARGWWHYLFDPASPARTAGDDGYDKPAYWNCAPLAPAKKFDPNSFVSNPVDPDAIAYANPVHYRKAVFLGYVGTLRDMGDHFYRMLTPDTLNNAKLRYVQALQLMGPRPDTAISTTWRPRTLSEAARGGNFELAAFEASAAKADAAVPALGCEQAPGLVLLNNEHFRSPANLELLSNWQQLESRLHNLRHNLTLDGKPLSLPLFATPMDPRQLQSSLAASGGGAGAGALPLNVPPYRFRALLPGVIAAVETLRGYGSQLQSYLEAGDRSAQDELQHRQLLDMADITLTLQQEALAIAEAGRESLAASRVVVEQRCQHYHDLYQMNMSATETYALTLGEASKNMLIGVGATNIAMGAARMIPNVYGMAVGGIDFGALLEGTAKSVETAANSMQLQSAFLDRAEQYVRRREEWGIQYRLAESEMAAVDLQLAQQEIQISSARTSISQAELQIQQAENMYVFLQKRFSGRQLYQWLGGQMSAMYYRLYDVVMSQCRDVQAAWQFEIGDFVTRQLPVSAWTDSYRGLLAGEQLRLGLVKMEADYLKRNERKLEITKTISLKYLKEKAGGKDASWDKVISTLKEGEAVGISLSKKLFDADYKNHILRQIQWVSLSLPALVGPYQDVRATLTQTASEFITSSGQRISNLRASQSVVYSHGMEDSGMFTLNPEDDRYLPFEGTGAVSEWQLAFPKVTSKDYPKVEKRRLAMLDSLTDIILRVRYTAVQS